PAHTMPDVDRAVVGGGKVGGVDDVLYAERDAVQRGSGRLPVEFASVTDGLLGVDMGPCANDGIPIRYPLEARTGQFLTRQFLARDEVGRRRGGQFIRSHVILVKGPVESRCCNSALIAGLRVGQ